MNNGTIAGLDVNISITVNGEHFIGHRTVLDPKSFPVVPTVMLENYVRGVLFQLATSQSLELCSAHFHEKHAPKAELEG